MSLTINQLKRIIKEAIKSLPTTTTLIIDGDRTVEDEGEVAGPPSTATALMIDGNVKALFANRLSAGLFVDKLIDKGLSKDKISLKDYPVKAEILDGHYSDVDKFLEKNEISLKEALNARYKATISKNKLYITILRS